MDHMTNEIKQCPNISAGTKHLGPIDALFELIAITCSIFLYCSLLVGVALCPAGLNKMNRRIGTANKILHRSLNLMNLLLYRCGKVGNNTTMMVVGLTEVIISTDEREKKCVYFCWDKYWMNNFHVCHSFNLTGKFRLIKRARQKNHFWLFPSIFVVKVSKKAQKRIVKFWHQNW